MKKKSPLKTILIIVSSVLVVTVAAIFIVGAIRKSSIRTVSIEAAYRELMVGSIENKVTVIPVAVYPQTASNQNLVVSSSDNSVATASYENGNITVVAIKQGETTITLQAAVGSKIKDTCKISVKDVVVQDITFLESDEDEAEEISSVSLQKDGFEHEIFFDIEPLNGNLENLIPKFDANILENVYVNLEKQCIVVIPKIKVAQASTNVDIEIKQQTASGEECSPQYKRLQINLTPQQSYVRLGLSAGTSNFSYINNEFVYLEDRGGNSANYVYISPQLGFDQNFTRTAEFNLFDYNVYVDGVKTLTYNGKALSYEHKDSEQNVKFSIDRSNNSAFRVTTTESFNPLDRFLLTFEYQYTGAKTNIELVYLSTDSDIYGSSSYYLVLNNSVLDCPLGQFESLNFNFDKGVERGLLDIRLSEDDTNFIKNDDGSISYFDSEELMTEILRIEYVNNRMYIKYINAGSASITFVANYKYWDPRYMAGFSDGVSCVVGFNVTRQVIFAAGASDEIILNGSMFNQPFDYSKIKYIKQKYDIGTKTYNDFDSVDESAGLLSLTQDNNIFELTAVSAGIFRIKFYIDKDNDNIMDSDENNVILFSVVVQ